MRIAVVDDERPARSELKYLVEQCEPDAEIAEVLTQIPLLTKWASDVEAYAASLACAEPST